MRILITGASGLLGVTLALEAAKQYTVTGTTQTQKLSTQAFRVIQCDLLAPGAVEELLDKTQPEWVIHCAAMANVDACEANPTLAERLNAWLPKKLAENVARGGARLVYISTDAVFDGIKGNYTEEDTPSPLSVYARTKWHGEMGVAEVNPDAIIARVNFYGWSLTRQRSLAEFFYYNLTNGNIVRGFRDIFFCPLLVNDLGGILFDMLEKNLHGLFHVVACETISKYDFGLKLARIFSLDENLIIPSTSGEANFLASRSPKLTLLTSKLAGALGYSPPGIDQGLIKFYLQLQQGYPEQLYALTEHSIT
jgi:dTDP-4-dehydrorhamnose reductase